MAQENTKQRILMEALKLFSKEGYEAVSVEQIANAVGIKAPSLYKHYISKREIFNNILRVMEQQDKDNAAACSVPEQTVALMPEAYAKATVEDLISFSKMQFRYWTEDNFASYFRKMLTIEQYRDAEMNLLYHQYLGSGPLSYVADLLGSQAEALLFYGPMHLLYGVYDEAEDKAAVLMLLEKHLERWKT